MCTMCQYGKRRCTTKTVWRLVDLNAFIIYFDILTFRCLGCVLDSVQWQTIKRASEREREKEIRRDTMKTTERKTHQEKWFYRIFRVLSSERSERSENKANKNGFLAYDDVLAQSPDCSRNVRHFCQINANSTYCSPVTPFFWLNARRAHGNFTLFCCWRMVRK